MKPILERVEHQTEECFSCFEWSARTFVCPYHVHPEFEINYIVSSAGRRLVGDHLDSFKPGDLVLLGPGLPHMYVHRPPKKAPSNWARSWYIQFLPDCLGQSFFELPAMRSIRDLLGRARRGLRFPRATVESAAPLVRATLNERGMRRVVSFLQLLHTLAEAGGAKPMASVHFDLPQPPRSSRQLDLATAYIHRHLFEELTLSSTARQAHMSPTGFSRFFHRWMGRTFATYIAELRIASACQALLESDQSIAEVCFASGFRNLSNFNRQFRAFKGMSPREFRQRCSNPGARD
jgi:AraC-like DNA-binding protein